MKIVITGGPCSGKSSIISALKNRGFRTVSETAREVIADRHLDNSMTKEDAISIQRDIILRQIEKEKIIDGSFETYFLDRGAIDIYGYYMHLAGSIPDDLKNIFLERYGMVFMLEPLKFIKDDIRREDDAEALELHRRIMHEYRSRGYDIINVPVMDLNKRVKHILLMVEDLKKKIRNKN